MRIPLRPIERLRLRMQGMPRGCSFIVAGLLVLAALGMRYLAGWLDWPITAPFLFLIYAIGVSAVLSRGAGYFATILSSVVSVPYLPHETSDWIDTDWLAPVGLFTVIGVSITALIESQTEALEEARDQVWRRHLLLLEYRHRTRNDLTGIAALLRLRARYVTDPMGREALAEAAGHTVALGRIHSRMEEVRRDLDETAVVDVGEFVCGVCADLSPPVGDVMGGSGDIHTERAVPLGLLICELVAAARLDEADHVFVWLEVVGPDYVLHVIDDRRCQRPTDGMRHRLIGLLTAQIRGSLTETVIPRGMESTITFPAAAPILVPKRGRLRPNIT